MAEIQLLGMTHYPPFNSKDAAMGNLHRIMLADPAVPAEAADPASWPPAQQAEWADDGGTAAAARHRAALIDGFDRVRTEIDAFAPDLVLIWGDDQHENFRRDLIPPFAVLAYDDLEVEPWRDARQPNFWDEPADTVRLVRGHPEAGRWLATALLDAGVDVAYAYEPLHHRGFAHAFLNTVLFLDHRRSGFDVPVLCMPVNCYGRKVIAAAGAFKPFGTPLRLDPPSPPPWRLMDVGAATVRALQASPWRVSVVASSSWSHAFLVDHNWRLRPDTDADRALYDALVAGDWDRWATVTTAEIEHAGQQEVLNWFVLAGAARELGATPSWSTFVETWCFNSNKVFAVWEPR